MTDTKNDNVAEIDFVGFASDLLERHGKNFDELAKKEGPFDEETESTDQDEKARRLEINEVPARIRDVILGGLEQTKPVQVVNEWLKRRAEDKSLWLLVLSSDKGGGKSVAAGYWLSQMNCRRPKFWCDKDKTDVYLPSWWMISAFSRVGGYDGKLEALCKHNGPLVLDDLGTEYSDKNGWFAQTLDSLVDARYSEYRPTLITTNLSAIEFKRRYSERIADRIREGGRFAELQLESLRKK